MKKILLLFVFLPLLCFSSVTKILFIGNSYTYTNDLPGTLYQFALAGGDTIFVDSYAPGGYTFQNHSTDANAIAKINSNHWDYVVLQEQSQTPAFPPSQVATDCYPYASILDSIILANDSCTKIVFYMTWGRKYGDASNCASYPPICTFSGMEGRLRESYLEMAQTNHAMVAPAGEAFKYSMIADSTVNLYVADNSHPSVYGTYLIASVFYGTIFQKTPVGITYLSSLTSPEVAFLQNIAFHTVFDSTAVWMLNTYKAVADFTDSINGLQVQFKNATNGISHFHWDFGDGSSSSLENPAHLYAAPGNYSVTCYAENHCETDTFTTTVNVSVNSSLEFSSSRTIQLYPIPTKDELIVAGLIERTEIEIINVLGEMVYSSNEIQNAEPLIINARAITDGIYFLKLKNSSGSTILKFIKN